MGVLKFHLEVLVFSPEDSMKSGKKRLDTVDSTYFSNARKKYTTHDTRFHSNTIPDRSQTTNQISSFGVLVTVHSS